MRLSRRSPGLRLLQMARDEAHRFAVTFQRARRAKRTVTSQLLEIPGVGPNRRRALLTAFGSVQGVKDAGLDAIAQVPGFSKAMAVRVLSGLGIPVPDMPVDVPWMCRTLFRRRPRILIPRSHRQLSPQ